jgi:hypothetical protein
LARTTSGEVAGIIETDGTISLSPFITAASSLVDWLQGKDTDGELSSSLLTEIEKWLAAHFYAHRDQLLSSKSTSKASGSFQGQTGMVLSSTQYGQTAMLLDVTGILAARSKQAEQGTRPKASMVWLGSTKLTQDDYGRSGDDR